MKYIHSQCKTKIFVQVAPELYRACPQIKRAINPSEDYRSETERRFGLMESSALLVFHPVLPALPWRLESCDGELCESDFLIARSGWRYTWSGCFVIKCGVYLPLIHTVQHEIILFAELRSLDGLCQSDIGNFQLWKWDWASRAVIDNPLFLLCSISKFQDFINEWDRTKIARMLTKTTTVAHRIGAKHTSVKRLRRGTVQHKVIEEPEVVLDTPSAHWMRPGGR